MAKVLTIAEVDSQYDAEWVLIGDPEIDESLELLAGRVLCDSKDRDEVYRRAVQLRPKRFAMHYTGKMPENTAIVL